MSVKLEKQFKWYAPSIQKSYDLNEDGTLTIEGIASTTNKDLQGDIILPEAIHSMKQQLTSVTKNLHGDHQYNLFNGIIGVIKEVIDTDEDSLKIKAIIRSKFASEIKEMLDIGINLGLSIGGRITEYNPLRDGWEIKDIDLMEISLTGMPANMDTFGTITTTKGVVEAKCLAGACHMIRKNIGDNNMSEQNETNKESTAEVFTKDDAVNLFNELMSNKQEEIARETVTQVTKELGNIVKEELGKFKDSLNENNNNEEEEEEEEETKSSKNFEESLKKTVEEAVNNSVSTLLLFLVRYSCV